METPNPSHQVDPEKEILRFTFCGIIIASFFASLAASAEVKTFLTPAGSQIATIALGLSALAGFAYIMFTAAFLKYQSPGRIDRFRITVKVTEFFFDASINILGVYGFILIVQWILAHIFHVTRLGDFILFGILGSGLFYFVAQVAWIAVVRLIEAYYDRASHLSDVLESKRSRK